MEIGRFIEMHNWVVSTNRNAATGNALAESYTDVDGVVHTHDTSEYRLAKFKMEFEDHFDMHFALIYYVYTFFALMVDQRAKNMFLTYWGETDKWYFYFYDNDTCFGINNEGQLVYDYYHEDTDQLGGVNVYNGQNSTLWCNFRDSFPDKIKETYQSFRSKNLLTYDKLEERFIAKGSDKWSESIYNEDADFKYISMLETDNDASNLDQVRGTGEEHFRYFIENRLNYCDGKWYAPEYADDYILLRINTPKDENGNPRTDLAVDVNFDITVIPFSHMYAGVRYKANGTLYQKRVEANEVVTFEAPDEVFDNTETAIFGASQLSSLVDLSPLYCSTINVSKATKLTELIIGNGTEGYVNANLISLSVGTNYLLKVLNIRNCPKLTGALSLAGCPNIEEIYAAGSGITGVELSDAGYLKVLELPATVSNLTLENQPYIESLTLEGYDTIKTINIENCPTVPSLDILGAATNVERVRLTNVDWKYDTAAEVLALAERDLAGIDENGVNTDKMWIDGKCHIKTLTGADYLKIKEAFPYITITYDNLTAVLTYMSEDGSEKLHEETVYNGGDGAYAETNFTKPSTAQYDFTFGGWSLSPNGEPNKNALKNVEADRTVYAAFNKSLRKYTVKFYNGSTLLETKTVEYGSDATYTGVTPVHPTAPDDCEFRAWKPEPTNIQGDTNCYAQWYDKREITDDWATIAQACLDGTATEKYAIGAFKTLDIGVKDLPYDFEQSSAVIYNDEIHILGSSASAYRTSHYKWTGTEWVEVSTLPYEFYYGSAVVYNNEIHIFGGSSTSTARTKHYKWDGSSWTSVSTLPYKFSEGIAIVYNNEIHIMSSVESSNYTSHYKWTGSEWTEVGVLPYNLCTASAVIYNNELHVLGSYDSNHDTSHYKWNGSTWTSVSTLPQKLSNGHALVVGTDIYMIQWDEFYKYDGTSWSTVPEVPANVYEGCSVVLDGVIYVMGSSVSGNRKVFFSYTPETETWSKVGITESIPMEIIAHNHDELASGYKWEAIAKPTNIPQYGCAVAYQNEVHALGGNSSSSYTQHIKWDDTNSTWVTVSTLPYQFRSGCAVILNDEIHILGSYQTTNKTEHYKWNATDGWVSVSTLPYSFYCSSAVVLNNEIHILGSYDSSCRKCHYKWNGTEWTSVSTLPYNFYYGSSVVYNGEIHIFSGSGGSTKHYKWDGSAWTSVSTLPYDLQYGVATIINNEIHIFGGSDNETGHYKWDGTEWTSMTTLPGGFNNYPLAVCNGTPYIFISTSCYKLVGASWVEACTKTQAYGKYAVHNDKIYIIYGRLFYRQDLENNSLITLASPEYAMHNQAYLISYNNELHLFTVENVNSNNTLHYIYDETNNVWTEGTPSPVSNYGTGIIVYNDAIYHFGPFGDINNHIYKYDSIDGWVDTGVVNPDRYVMSNLVVYDNKIHMIVGSNNATNRHYTFDGNVWTLLGTTPFEATKTSFVVHGNKIHAFSGDNNPNGHFTYDGVEWTNAGLLPFRTYGFNQAVVYRNKIYAVNAILNAIHKSTLVRLENPKAPLTFLAKNLLKDKMRFGSVIPPKWSSSDIRTFCNNDFYNSLPEDLQSSISEVIKVSDTGYDGQSLENVIDKVWICSSEELCDDPKEAIAGQGSVYPVFTDNASRIRSTLDGVNNQYWTRSTKKKSSSAVIVANKYGYVGEMSKGIDGTTNYVLPGFCI